MRWNPENWGYKHPGCGPQPGRFSGIPIPNFFGIYVKLGFPTNLPSHFPQVEWMWVLVHGPAETPGQELYGELNQDPVFASYQDGDGFEFRREEITDIFLPDHRSNPLPEEKRNHLRKWLRRRLEKLRRSKDFDYFNSLLSDLDRVDPSKTGKYSAWILNQIILKKLIVPDDYLKVQNILTDFLRIKNRLPVQYRNIQNFKDFTDLYRVVSEYLPQTYSISELAQRGTELLYEDERYKIYELTTPEAVVAVSQNTGWCTCDKKTAAKYLEESSLSIVYRHGEDDWEKHLLIHPASKEINHPDNSEYENYDPHLVEIIIDYFPTMYCNVHRRFQNLQCYSCDERGCCEFIKCGIDGCNTYMCSDKECLKQCKTCEVPYCADHIIEECHLCYGQLCRDDVETCNECNRPYCASHKSDCAICDQTFCDECFELCSDCNLRYCSDCSFECSNCQNSSCSACAERSKTLICPICENLSCEDCIEDCQECEREICHGCMSDGGICDNCYG